MNDIIIILVYMQKEGKAEGWMFFNYIDQTDACKRIYQICNYFFLEK